MKTDRLQRGLQSLSKVSPGFASQTQTGSLDTTGLTSREGRGGTLLCYSSTYRRSHARVLWSPLDIKRPLTRTHTPTNREIQTRRLITRNSLYRQRKSNQASLRFSLPLIGRRPPTLVVVRRSSHTLIRATQLFGTQQQ